ncbi:hypothetical protein J1605_014070 [Eschrichtius robustus]|uniref:Uncharacterized protein n=1 Tax=Eschrichtius robustus TaxID=9764 RepID=A0AB34GGG6_ESCRO|nr:hypothetical protein J1605_014070 [Eschrichtius robustus]
MASSCASIDIEDATQHLRDILKLDRPAGGEPERWGWVLGERAEGRCGPRPPSWPSGHSGPALHPPGCVSAEGEAPSLSSQSPPGVLAATSLVFLELARVPYPFATVQRPSLGSVCGVLGLDLGAVLKSR